MFVDTELGRTVGASAAGNICVGAGDAVDVGLSIWSSGDGGDSSCDGDDEDLATGTAIDTAAIMHTTTVATTTNTICFLV